MFKPPNVVPIKGIRENISVFLAGSIEMGKAEDWQKMVYNEFPFGFDFINPRRDDWDTSWEQSINNPNFNEQVTWELDYLELCDIPFFYFQPGTVSPISLLELGLHIKKQNLVVCCPPGFHRKGNVDILCHRYGVKVYESLSDAIKKLRTYV